MRAIICLITITSAASALESLRGHGDSWTTIDKEEHLACGFLIGGLTTFLADKIAPDAKRSTKILVGIGAAVIAGTLKEVYDSRHPESHDASTKDAVATYAGGVVGALAVGWSFKF